MFADRLAGLAGEQEDIRRIFASLLRRMSRPRRKLMFVAQARAESSSFPRRQADARPSQHAASALQLSQQDVPRWLRVAADGMRQCYKAHRRRNLARLVLLP